MTSSRQKIWITRTQPGAQATAERVRALGHEAFVAPLLTVAPVENVRIDLEGVSALAFTSANAVRAFAARQADRSLKVFAVGAATAEAARAAGFKTVLHTRGDVAVLARALVERRRELTGEVLHPGAAEPAGDLVGALERYNVPARDLVVYESTPAELTPEELARLPEMDAVLVHSARAAKALAAILRAHPAPQIRVLGISKAAIAPLARCRVSAKLFAESPLEADLLNLIDRST